MADQVGVRDGCPRRREVIASDEVDLGPGPDLVKSNWRICARKIRKVQYKRLQLRRRSLACGMEYIHHAGSTCARGLIWRAHFTTRADVEEALRCPPPSAPVTDEPSSRGGSPRTTENCRLQKSKERRGSSSGDCLAPSAENGGAPWWARLKRLTLFDPHPASINSFRVTAAFQGAKPNSVHFPCIASPHRRSRTRVSGRNAGV